MTNSHYFKVVRFSGSFALVSLVRKRNVLVDIVTTVNHVLP